MNLLIDILTVSFPLTCTIELVLSFFKEGFLPVLVRVDGTGVSREFLPTRQLIVSWPVLINNGQHMPLQRSSERRRRSEE